MLARNFFGIVDEHNWFTRKKIHHIQVSKTIINLRSEKSTSPFEHCTYNKNS